MSTATEETVVADPGPADAGQQAESTTTRTAPSRPGQRARRERRNNNNNRNRQASSNDAPVEVKFTGRCAELKGEVYDCSEYSQVDGYTKTTKEIAEYVGRAYSADARTTVETLALPTFAYPDDPAADATETTKRRWQKKVDSMVMKEDRFEEDLTKVYSLIWGQCTEYLRAKLEARDSFGQVMSNYDTIELLKSIKDCVFKFSDEKHASHSLHEASRKFYTSQQDKNSNIQDYYQRFKNHIEVVEHCGGSLGGHDAVINKSLEAMSLTRANASVIQLKAATAAAREEYLACAFLLGSDRKRYEKLVEDLENDYIQKIDKYPKTMVEAYSLLIHWKQDPKNLMRVLGMVSDGVAFANVGTDQHGTANEHPHITCYNCQEQGHYASVCTNETVTRGRTNESGTQALLAGAEAEEVETEEVEEPETTGTDIDDYDDDSISFSFLNVSQEGSKMNGNVHHQGATVSKDWILLDNQSTVDVFCNPKLLKNIRKANKIMNIKCNAGVTRTDKIGDLPGYGEVWFNEKGIANILLLSKVEEKYRITYDSADSKQFIVHKENGSVRKFTQSASGLFYLDARKAKKEKDGTVLVNTVEDNKTKYTNAVYKQAVLARRLQNIIGRP
jgi:hypothetical protein